MPAPRILALIATAVLAVAACSTTGAAPVATVATSSPAPSTAAGSASPAAVVVGASSSAKFGTILTGPNGMSLYTHAGDSATASTCTGACATAWPPLTTTGQPSAGAGVTGKLGTLARADGTTQVSYNGLPLYTWQGDTKAGDVTGDGVAGFKVATVGGAANGAPKATVAAPASSMPSTGGYGY